MIFNTSTELGKRKADEYYNFLVENKKIIEIINVRKRRTPKQNRYFHVIISHFALEYGETAEWVKQELFKKQLNKDIFIKEYTNRKTGEIREDWRSSKELDTKEMTDAIERFRNWSSKEAGIYIPQPNEEEYLREIENQIKINRQWI